MMYMEQFTMNSLPMNDRQLEAILTITKLLKIDQEHGLILSMPNNDDPQEIRIQWIDDGYFVGLTFPMNDFGWTHPLLLAAEGLPYEDVEMMIKEICMKQMETGDIELINKRFRDVTGEVYGDEHV